MLDRETDVVPGDGRRQRHNAHDDDVELPGGGVHRGGDQDGLPRHRDPEVFEEHESGHSKVATTAEAIAHQPDTTTYR